LSGLNAKIDRHSNIFGEYSPWAKICDSSSHLPFKLQDSNWADLVRLCGVEINNSSLFSVAKRVKVSGRYCSQGTVFLRKREEELLPIFYQIKEIFYSGNVTIFIMQAMTTMYFDRDRFSFILSPSEEYCAILPSDLIYPVPMHSFFFDDEIHVVPSYYSLL
jgi:hypothetical protein